VACDCNGRVGLISKCGANFTVPLKKKWRISKSDWGNQSRKTVRQISLFTATDLTLTLISDKRKSALKIRGKNEVQKRRISFSGRRIGIDIETDKTGVNIS
ncbi:MAG: hypothetical protein IKC64_05235, partial [Clostridia bacterium]|nr:hypothetical protein [Clostridia bacterium]